MASYSHRLSPLAFRVYQNIEKHALFIAGNKIILSFSTGLDSTALACLFLEIQNKLPFSFVLVYFHHGLRQESDAEAEFTALFAKKHNLEHYIFYTTTLEKEKNLQKEARIWRYSTLEKLQKESNTTKIALAHHKDDVIETLLWRMFRGASLFTLHPLTFQRSLYIRPLLNIKKKELETYLQEKKQTWFEDASNQETGYTRNKIRHNLIPFMNRFYQGTSWQKNLLHLSEESHLLEEVFDFYVPCSVWQKEYLTYKELQSLPILFARKTIYSFLSFHDQQNVRYEHIVNIEELVRKNQGNWHIGIDKKVQVFGSKKKVMLVYKEL